MSNEKSNDPKKTDEKIVYESFREMPPMAVSQHDMSYNKTGSWRTLKPEVDPDKCTGCTICWKFCPESAIRLHTVEKNGKEKVLPVINYDYCKGCGICWTECPADAIRSIEEEK